MRKDTALGIVLGVGAGAALLGMRSKQIAARVKPEKHLSESEASYRRSNNRILILGAGFGGLQTALKLDQQMDLADGTSVLVVNRDNDMLFAPLLWTAANGRTTPNNVVVPIRNFQKNRRFHILHADVEGIDLDHKEVQTSAGSRPYDRLVIALGSHTAIPDLPGLRENAIPFRAPSDALQLRNHLIDAVESAHQTTDMEERKAWLTFVVGGAGDTGVELAAIIHDYIVSGLFREYPWLQDASIRIIVIGHADRVLPMGSPETSKMVQKVLEQQGIEVLTGTAITAASETSVTTDKEIIPMRTLFWAAGVTPPNVVQQLPVKHARIGAFIVDEHLRIPDNQDVYVIGDSAWAYDSSTNEPVPATAQAAGQQGKYVGATIALDYAGKQAPTYRYSTQGHLALIGHRTGVAEIGRFTFSGFPAFILWHLVYLERIPSWAKRIRLVTDWLISALLGPDTGQMRLSQESPRAKKVISPRA